MGFVNSAASKDVGGCRPGLEIIELTTDEVAKVQGGWLPVAGLMVGVAGRVLGGWSGAIMNRVGFGIAVFETARWLGGGGERYGNSGSPRE